MKKVLGLSCHADDLELGCGATPRKGYDGIDEQDFGQKYVGDVETVLNDFEDNSVFFSYDVDNLCPECDEYLVLRNEGWKCLHCRELILPLE